MKLDRKNHPRPQFIRENWQSLDGKWDFAFDEADCGRDKKWYEGFKATHEICVPFTYETKLSGINKQEHHKVVWYQREVKLSKDKPSTLYFDAVDYYSEIWLNGSKLGDHKGGSDRFSFELPKHLIGDENIITVRVEDSLSCSQPRGKQRWVKDNFGCWYVQTTGIWKSVWIEETCSEYKLEKVKMTPDLDNNQIIFEPQMAKFASYTNEEALNIEIEVSFDGKLISKAKVSNHRNLTPIAMDTALRGNVNWGTQVWCLEAPNLYDVSFRLYDEAGTLLDEVFSYFGMRKISIENSQVLLNNRPLYQRLVLDQGYWEESGITPPSVDALEKDVDRILEMGYNGLRKHQKIEDERFIYLCDLKGVLMWAEMPATYSFDDVAIRNLTREWLNVVEQQYNHPSIITWVPFNESWGIQGILKGKKQQQWTKGVYYLTKAIDSERPVVTNDGWEHTISDILTLHDYEEFGEILFKRYADKDAIIGNEIAFNNDWFAFAKGHAYAGQPVIISEFGGIAFERQGEGDSDLLMSNGEQVDEESGSGLRVGYGRYVANEEAFLDRFDDIHKAIQDLPYVSGFCYTQLTDVEQEVNGLLDVNREMKVDIKRVRKVNERRTR